MYAPMVEMGQGAADAVDRHTKLVTSQILEMLVERGPQLGKAFCDVDPDRGYLISKEQFANALGTACKLSCFLLLRCSNYDSMIQ